MGKRYRRATVIAAFVTVTMMMLLGKGRSAGEATDVRARPGSIPDSQGYWQNDPFDPGKVSQTQTPQAEIDARAARQREAKSKLGVEETTQILFGDMHVHSTYSGDAFRFSLPLMQGSRGAHPPADACDDARYISQLDFYWITDPAEPYTPQHWKDSVEAIRQCNAVAGDSQNPDIEVVRIRPQERKDESVEGLIEDQWKVFTCERNRQGCTVEFEDPDFSRDTVYYVRAIEEDTPTVNGKNLRTTFDKNGNALDVTPCYGDYRTEETDECLAMAGQRVWSSPIYVDHVGE